MAHVMSEMCGSGLCVVLLVSLLCPCCSALENLTVLAVQDSFSNSMPATHVTIITIPLVVTAVAACIAGAVAVMRSLRVTVLLVLFVWLALISVGTISWSVTYVATRDIIMQRAQDSIASSASRAADRVSRELGSGVDILTYVQFLAGSEHFNPNASWPHAHHYLSKVMQTVGRETHSIWLVHYGTKEGRLQGVETLHATGGGESADERHYVRTLPGDYLPSWARCSARDWAHVDCSSIVTTETCADPASQAAMFCGVSCGFPERSTKNCIGKAAIFATNLEREGATSTGPDGHPLATEAGFQEPPPEQQSVVALLFENYGRPWWTRSRTPVWTAPFQYATNWTGITVSAAVEDSAGVFLGAVAVNFRLANMNTFMVEIKPSANGVAFLLVLKDEQLGVADAQLVGSSMDLEELTADTGTDHWNTLDSIVVSNFAPSSKIVLAVEDVEERWGSLEAALAANSMYYSDDNLIASYPIHLPGSLTMLLVVSVPLSDIMGEADAASTISLVTTLSISILLALLTALGMMLALNPLNQLREDMYDVACMNLEGYDQRQRRSHLTEVRSMQESFHMMVQNLTEYKHYLPQSVLRETDSDAQDTSQTSKHHHQPRRITPTSSRSSSSSLDTELVRAEVGHHVGVRLRNISLLVSNVSGFLRCSKSLPALTTLSLHAAYLEKIVGLVNRNRGIVDEFIGDKVHASFNTIVASSSHRTHAAECINAIRVTSFVHEETVLEVNAAAVAMKALCGNFGCKGMKKYTVFGTHGSSVWTYERWGKAWGAAALVDASIAGETGTLFILRMIAKVRVHAVYTNRDSYLYAICGTKQVLHDEWMYQLEHASEQEGDIRQHNAAMACLYDGSLAEALRIIEGSSSCSKEAVFLRHWIRECVESGAAPRPVPLAYRPDVRRMFAPAEYASLPGEVAPTDAEMTTSRLFHD
eukprot:TRINITY_DN1004_c1_g1_i1.p1 TRINITY_DN1004_c1_g1~~TRINITY_DN1004_c1_g1_i1.p1  ORF type:complete len:933 (+),score=246.44 TRINITY_DN1004_c1_g1_i1:179-2977(+)